MRAKNKPTGEARRPRGRDPGRPGTPFGKCGSLPLGPRVMNRPDQEVAGKRPSARWV